MKSVELKSQMLVCRFEELTEPQKQLVELAKQQTKASYAPYSHFCVGSAARLSNGEVVVGSNQENAAYPSGLCAERTALFAAGAKYPHEAVESLAIACYTDGHFTKEPGSPCGACRQVMTETEHRYGGNMEVILYGENETYIFHSAKDLLPLIFVSENLNG